jgi:hypothetical protein
MVAGVGDVYGHRHFMLVDRDFLTARDGVSYLPGGVVFRDRGKGVALVEFAEEADSGAWRAWVPLEDLLENVEVNRLRGESSPACSRPPPSPGTR